MDIKYSLNKTNASPHIGHILELTEDVTLVCITCNEDLWRHADVLSRAADIQRGWYSRMRIEDPERYREINREKSRARRARLKKDPVKYAAYLEKAKEYNATATTKRKMENES